MNAARHVIGPLLRLFHRVRQCRHAEHATTAGNDLAILFGEKSDASTVLHELTHWYTEIVDRLAQQGSPWAVQQMSVLLDRWKLTREQWDAVPDLYKSRKKGKKKTQAVLP